MVVGGQVAYKQCSHFLEQVAVLRHAPLDSLHVLLPALAAEMMHTTLGCRRSIEVQAANDARCV